MVIGNLAKPGGAANDMLIGHPHRSGPHEGLVIEPGREKRLHRGIDRAHIEFQRWEPVLAFGIEPVIQLHLSGPQIRLGMRAASHPDQRIRQP